MQQQKIFQLLIYTNFASYLQEFTADAKKRRCKKVDTKAEYIVTDENKQHLFSRLQNYVN